MSQRMHCLASDYLQDIEIDKSVAFLYTFSTFLKYLQEGNVRDPLGHCTLQSSVWQHSVVSFAWSVQR